MQCHTRRASVSDAPGACDVVRRSIAELCLDDHGGDARTLSEWLANKTPADFEHWIQSDRHVAIAAELDGTLVGFALLNLGGTISLLYVSPEARFHGVSKALLSALEREALDAGISELRLESTRTAQRFYEQSGYASAGERTPGFGCSSCYPMSRRLSDA